ncbi:MAG TPA: hypothetical protein VKN99_27240 [Polyangia bacterium]|nr:hypothetical protein [Polyangia bacterium]
MNGRRVLFYDPDPRVVRIAERALTATGSDVTLATSEQSLRAQIEQNGYDLLMVNFDPPLADKLEWREFLDKAGERFPKTKLVLHVTSRTEDYLPLLAERRFLRNLIAKNDAPLEAEELIRTSEKILRSDIFGLEKYLLWGVEPYRVHVVDSREKPRYVQQVSDYAARLGCNPRTIELVETIVDEVVTNAIFNAPRDPDGKPKYAHLNRREPVTLATTEQAELLFACDGGYIGVAQVDPFGALTQDTVVGYLNRCLVKGPRQVEEKLGGAGIGLFRVFQSLSKFVINIEPNHRTEVIALIDLRLTMKKFKQFPKSFHIFVQEDGRA